MSMSPSFKSVVQQAKATDEALDNMEPSLFEELAGESAVLLELPKLGVNPTQDERLKFKNNMLPVFIRDISRLLNKKIADIGDSVYVSGAQGIGKSYGLYTCACMLRLQRSSNVRVTYVQSCREWVSSHNEDEYLYILNELCETFQDDVLPDNDSET